MRNQQYKFELHVKCSKDIDKLKIDFADGTSAIQEPKYKEPDVLPKQENPEPYHNNGDNSPLLDTDADFGSISQDVVELPDIHRAERPVNVASELQNLDI